jgi:hypothetical protein
MRATGKSGEHIDGVVAVTRFPEYVTIQNNGRIGTEHDLQAIALNRRGFRARQAQYHRIRCLTRQSLLIHGDTANREAQAQRLEYFATSRRRRCEV